MKKQKGFPKRPWATRYTGSQGHCCTPMGAKIAAATYLVKHEQKSCTIEGPDGKPVAQLHYNTFWGLTMVPIRSRSGAGTAKILNFKRRA
jgi:hypothetical protein